MAKEIKKQKFNQAFTLIEVMVVVSIISLLASIILVQFKDAREKARFAAAKSFDSQVYRVAGDQMVGDWEFNECQGNTVADNSGFGNNGTFVGSPQWIANFAPFGAGCSISFSGASNYIDVPKSRSLNMTNNFTVSLWVYITDTSGANIFLLKGDDVVGGLAPSYGFNGYGFMAIANDISNAPHNNKQSNDAGVWHELVAVVDGTTRYLYEDGHLIDTHPNGGDSWNNNDDLWIGRGASYSANGILDEVRVYNKTLTAYEVQQMYALDTEKLKTIALAK